MDRSDAADIFDHFAFAELVVPIQLPVRIGESGRYELIELIARTPRSHVYLAHDGLFSSERHESKVIVKITPTRERGVLEALAARQIESPYVVRVLDRGQFSDVEQFVVLERVGGGDLSEHQVPWEPRRAATFVSQLAEAAQAAHSAGITHCDLKPSNILVTPDGQPRLADFDLAVETGETVQGRRGNLAFAAPEQIRCDEGAHTPLADVYALGGILYYLLTGQPPNGTTVEDAQSTAQGRRTPPPLRGPSGLVYICSKALSPASTDRYQTARDLCQDLDAWLNLKPIPTRQTGVAERAWLLARRRPLGTASILLLIALIAGGTTWWVAWQFAERNRQIAIEREANALAQKEIEHLRQRVRQSIVQTVNSLRAVGATSSADRLAVTMYYMRRMGDVHAPLGEQAATSSDAEAAVLADAIQTAENAGRSKHLDVQFTRLLLSERLLRLGRADEAMRTLRRARELWGDRLVAGEMAEITQRSLELLCEARAGDRRRGALNAEIGALRDEAISVNAPAGIIELLTRELERLAVVDDAKTS